MNKSSPAATDTPMMIQYRKLKQENRDSILFFRLGDFYEMFETDAKIASSILGINLTKRHHTLMCGIPYHARQNYVSKLLKAGKKIAICEQTELPRKGRGIAKREVVEVITPGTVVDENLLEKNTNNYLLALASREETFSLSYIDLSTSEFFATSFPTGDREERIKRELLRLAPKEIIIQDSLVDEDIVIKKLLHEREDIVLNRYPDWYFDKDTCNKTLMKQFRVKNLKGFGLDEDSPEIITAGVLLDYIGETAKSLLPHISSLKVYTDSDYLLLDESTQRNLELIRNLQDSSKKYTLLWVLDHTRTSMGARKLKKWILNPLISKKDIEARLDAVDFLYRNQILLSDLRETTAKILDIERLSARVAMERAHPKDLVAIKSSLEGILNIYESVKTFEEMASFAGPIEAGQGAVSGLVKQLEEALLEEPSIQLNEGKIIREGYHKELDRQRNIKENAREVLEQYLLDEKRKSGINNLKLRYNKIIGYFLEVTKSNLDLVPQHFIRRQSLVGSERYSTEELSEKEIEINSASEKIVDLEKELFLKLRKEVKQHVGLLLELADHVSTLDVLQSFSYAATVYGFIRPKLTNKKELRITGGRHPVVEANLPGGSFIPNSLHLSEKSGHFVLLTGPNMAGKSTFLRQIAIITLMSQLGSFVPAAKAEIGLVDRIFCRVGATDNLARGESTFLVEMNETANILRSATDKSLLILDEVGRGTSTNDGLSIAWSVSDYILKKIKAKTLFATHYHELTALKHNQLVNLSMDVIEQDGEIVFLKRIKEGPADSSYGIHVANLAGLPLEVIANARKILSELSKNSVPLENVLPGEESSGQGSLFSPYEMICSEIRNLRINNTTPLKALNIIAKWQKEINEI